MKVTDLRIGNLLRDKLTGSFLRVDELTIEGKIIIHVIDRSKFPLPKGWQLDELPITNELLWKCKLGYVSTDERFNFIGVNGIEYVIDQQDDWWYVGIEHGDGIHFFAWDLYYFHQLQNLYFALTGKELEFKQ